MCQEYRKGTGKGRTFHSKVQHGSSELIEEKPSFFMYRISIHIYILRGDKMVILIPICGLCNRMRTINSMYYFCKNTGKKLVVLWVINEDLGAATTDLFSLPKDIRVFNISMGKIEGKVWKIFHWILSHLFCYLGNVEIKQMRDEKITPRMRTAFKRGIVVCETDADIIARKKCRIFRPMADIEKQYKMIIENRGKYAAFHIRRTDNMKARKYSKTELFEKKINELIQHNQYSNIYLATDDMALKKRLSKEYSSYIFGQEIKEIERESILGIKEAYIELLCLSRAEVIYGSYWSSFSEMAEKIGNSKLIIVQ